MVSYIINVRRNKPREVSMEPKINIRYRGGRGQKQINCTGPDGQPWEKEEIEGMLAYYNGLPTVEKAWVTMWLKL